jgi:hypothetical protein
MTDRPRWRDRTYREYVGLKPYRFIPKEHKLDIPQKVLDDRARRYQLWLEQDATAEFFNDPLCGYSALDKRNAENELEEASTFPRLRDIKRGEGSPRYPQQDAWSFGLLAGPNTQKRI